jgi:hypothetical protein
MKAISKILPISMILFIALAPVPFIGQIEMHSQNRLQEIHGQFVVFEDIIDSESNTMVVFWNSNNKKHIEYLDQLHEQQKNAGSDNNFHVVAICTDRYHNYQKLQVMLAGKDWGFDFYLDVNESFMHAYGMSGENLQVISINGYENEMLTFNRFDQHHGGAVIR